MSKINDILNNLSEDKVLDNLKNRKVLMGYGRDLDNITKAIVFCKEVLFNKEVSDEVMMEAELDDYIRAVEETIDNFKTELKKMDAKTYNRLLKEYQ